MLLTSIGDVTVDLKIRIVKSVFMGPDTDQESMSNGTHSY